MIALSAARRIAELPDRYNAAEDIVGSNLAAGRGGKIAVIDAGGALTYSSLYDQTSRMAGALAELGVRREERVLLCLLDTVEFPIAFFGCIKAGVVPVPLNTLLATEDYRWYLENSRARAVIVSAELTDAWSALRASRPDIAFISTDAGAERKFAELLSGARAMTAAADTHRDEVAFWQYSSGSTGKPKAAMHAHASPRLAANLFGAGVVGYREDDVVYSVAKQFFGYGLGNSALFPFSVGATTVLNKERPTPAGVAALMRLHRVTILHGVPTFYAAWFGGANAPNRDDAPALRLGVSAGESLPSHLGEDFRRRFGVDLIDGIGSTEMLHIFLSQRPGEVQYGRTGKPVPGYDVRLVDDLGGAVADGDLGELHVRGPTAACGYWHDREKSQATFQGEWTRTGDKFRRDAQGWYSYGGRSDDMMKVGGIYVSPTEVEEALASHVAVLEAAVVGAPDENGLIKPCAHIVLKDGVVASDELEAALKAHVKALLAPFKYPRRIVFERSLPKTATGKIQRFRLREVE